MMSEYDLQFQADLERAQELSLESLALEQFRRQKLATADSAASGSARRRDESDAPTPPALPPPPRRPSRARPPGPAASPAASPAGPAPTDATTDRSSGTSGTSPTTDESSDLISFASPTSKSAPRDPHAYLKEYIEQLNRLGQQTEEVASNADLPPGGMSAPPYGAPRPGHPPPPPHPHPHGATPQYPYNYQQPHSAMPPYPGAPAAAPYGMPAPAPAPGYTYYPPPMVPPDASQYAPLQANPMYPAMPYNQTRMATPAPAPAPYGPFPPTRVVPAYNFNTTNMIARPTRPVNLYPQLNQMPGYPPMSSNTEPGTRPSSSMPSNSMPMPINSMPCNSMPMPSNSMPMPSNSMPMPSNSMPMPSNSMPMPSPSMNNNTQALVMNEPSRDSAESNASREFSELNIGATAARDAWPPPPAPSPAPAPARASLNLIDFGGRGAPAQGSVRVSVLEAFDPLLSDQNNYCEYAVGSEGSGSVYEEYDPLDFLYGETEMRDSPAHAHAHAGRRAAPAPPPKAVPTIPAVPAVAMRSTTNKLYDCIVQTRTRNYDSEHQAFLKMVLDVRKRYVWSDGRTNPGHVVAARSGGRYPAGTSVKILVHHDHSDEPITFTSDVESTVEHVILTVACTLEEEIREDMSGYNLRVWGAEQYLTAGTALSEYDYVRECVRLEKDVRLCVRGAGGAGGGALARTARDDARDGHLTLDDLIPSAGAAPMLSFDNLSILLQTLEGELSRAVGVTSAEGSCSSRGVFQAVKAICALAGGVETLHVTTTMNAFAQACHAQGKPNGVTPEIESDGGGAYCAVSVRAASAREAVALQCARVRDAVRALVALYARTRLVDFRLADAHYLTPANPDKAVPAHTMAETALVCVEAVHCVPAGWQHDEYLCHAQLYHGTRPLKALHLTHSSKIECGGFYPRIIFDTWLNFEDLPLNTLPRESRLVLTLYGRIQRADEPHPGGEPAPGEPGRTGRAGDTGDPGDDAGDPGADPGGGDAGDVQYEQVELGWAAIQMYNYDGMLASGHYVLPLWPPCCDRRIGPAPHHMTAPPAPHPLVNIEIPLYAQTGVKWTEVEAGARGVAGAVGAESLPPFDSLDGNTQLQLLQLVEKGAYQRMPTDGREVLWEKRQYLVELAGALPLVLLAATSWYGEPRAQLVALLRLWRKPSPLNAMHLMLPCFPDGAVRALAAELAGGMSDDELCRVLPQLAQALRHETYEAGPLAALLLSRALASPAVAHRLFWLLVHSLPNVPQAPSQEFLGISVDESAEAAPSRLESHLTAEWRYRLVLRALLATCGENLTATLVRQQLLVKTLSEVAMSVKGAKEGLRQRALVAGGERLALLLRHRRAALPLALHRYVHDVDVKSCSYFSSNTLPLKINFIGSDNAVVPAMFKVGDDLRQDALVLQVIKVMDTLWLQAGLDLRMVMFQALPTTHNRGMIEIVSEAETLRAIQTEWGLTGSFKDKPIAEWLAKHNPSELEYQRARDNFTASCAGYSVATYLLGVCDRHNDNIMLKTSGHLFHIDFGKFLGDAQMFGNFRRDRAPFVLTSDMVYVINGGERPTQRFQHFVEQCCMAFNVVRAHHDHILDLFALMSMSGVTGVTSAAVGYVRAALLPAATNAEAAAAFARLIHSSLKSKFTPINFFLHNLAQMRASGDQGSATSELLSFMPRTYNVAQEGRLVSVECLGYEKRYDPEKHYVYALRIYRQGQATPFVLYRSYKHFTELYQKICLHYPLAKVHSLPSGLYVGRSNTRQVAERRFGDVQAFLTSLFGLADEIAHSDLVYTFFHPLLRDQQDVEPQRMKNRQESVEAASSGSGSLKVSVQYAGDVLYVLVLHAQSLAASAQGVPPNPYVKVYLIPDPNKETKRKTRVLKRNSHPSFMEMLEYRLELEVVRRRSLQATVWNYDSLQENQFLGGVVIPLGALPLREETVAWYPLEYVPR